MVAVLGAAVVLLFARAVSMGALVAGLMDELFLWPRRNALADGGGKGTVSLGGDGLLRGGDTGCAKFIEGWDDSAGGETSARNAGTCMAGDWISSSW